MRTRLLIPCAVAISLTACASAQGAAPDTPPGTLPATIAPVAAAPEPEVSSAPASAASTVVAEQPARQPGASTAFSRFDEVLSRRLIGHGAFSASVAVAKDGELVHEQAYGVADPSTGERATTRSRFRIGSISKSLLAIAVVQLAGQGRMALDTPGALDDVAASLGVAYGDPTMAQITLRQLLSHTSGFPEYERTFFGNLVGSCEEAATRGLTRGLLGPPGSLYRYSNMNYCLLGLIVQQATGRTYQDVVRTGVLRPLGIDEMRTVRTEEVGPGEVRHLVTAGRRYMEALGPAGAWVGTAGDLVRVFDALDPARPGPHLVTGSTLGEMIARPPVVFSAPDQWYGLGLRVWDNGASWGHTGTVENAHSMVLHQADGVTWAVLVNGTTPSNTDDLKRIVADALTTVTSWPD